MMASLLDIPSDWIIHLLLPLVRALFVGSTAIALGSTLLGWWGVPEGGDTKLPRDGLARLIPIALIFSVVMSIVWWPLISVEMTGASSLKDAFPLMPVVLQKTFFGGELRFRILLLCLAFTLWGLQKLKILTIIRSELRGAVLVVIAMVPLLQPLMGHGATVSAGYLLPMTLHVLAASIWIGCLPGLLYICRKHSYIAQQLLLKFSWWGIACVTVIGLTAIVQALALVASWHALYTTPYGQFLLVKCGLMFVMLGVASLNKFHWTNQANHQPRGLYWTLGLELVVGIVIVMVAALLSAEPPPGLMSM